ncbi:MAG: hypothetical protein KDN20_03805 [Verrucomicrobiae bacterium]|nr:hypothetical protein [Verrucomicrobiae bacterium]
MKRIVQRSEKRNPGYALISTLLVLSLVLLIVVALFGLQKTDATRVGQDRDLVEARANALYALDTALAELQRYAGPDQAVSGRADILEKEDGDPMPNPKWTGVWASTDLARNEESLGAFLVSGNERFDLTEQTKSYPEGYLEPSLILDSNDENVVTLVTSTDQASRDEVLVRRQDIKEPASKKTKGHYAYWVGDEGVKARVNLLDPYRESDDPIKRQHRFTVAQRSGVEAVLSDFDSDEDRLESITTMGEFKLLQEPVENLRPYFHDLTTHSVGLLTDTRHGGFRRDLTTAFESDRIFEREFGARRTGVTSSVSVSQNDLYTLNGSRLEDFYLVPEILNTARASQSNYGRWLGGPNWANLREYYLLYQKPETAFPFLPHPRCGVAMRHYSFNPYKHGKRSDKLDYYHRNSPVCPILSRAQMNVRLRTKKISGEAEEEKYQVDLEIQPVLGLWNPYNITLTERIYRFDWEISVFVDLRIDGIEKRYDLYRLWKSDSQPWFSLNTSNVTLEPGEFRLFTIDSRKQLAQRVNLVPRWSEDGAFWVNLPKDPGNRNGPTLVVSGDTSVEVLKVGLVAAVENSNWSPELKELQKHNTFMAIKYGETVGGASSSVESSSVRMNNLWKADDQSGPQSVPEPEDEIPPFRPSQHTTEPKHLASWAYYMRTSHEDVLGQRNFIDSNIRAIVANSRWDGSVEDRGWRAMGWLNDGLNRALLPPGNEEPEADGLARYRGFGGNSISATGQSHLIVFDVPREPLMSLGQLQHTNLGRYNNEPSFIVGNSYHNIRIPLDQTMVKDFAIHDTGGLYSAKGLDIFDLSHFVNETLWDSWFFSTVDPTDAAAQIDSSKEGAPLPNSRYRIRDAGNRLKADFAQADSDQEKYDVLAAGFSVEGAFNVNSTSVPAWKATLSSLRDLEVPIYNPLTGKLSAEDQGKIVFSRLSRPFSEAYQSDDSSTFDNFWRGYRELTDEQIESLATEMVRQVRLRGPFRSLADFVNRSLVDHDPSDAAENDTRLAGALQAALDRTIGANAEIDNSLASPVDPIPNRAGDFHDVPEATTQGTGFAGYLLQGDLLQALGPILTARSDTFRIRAYGDKVIVPRGQPDMEIMKARAWCEAIVQRIPEPVESLGDGYSETRDLIQRPDDVKTEFRDTDRPYFGRRFRIISFRWLAKGEL